MYNFFTVDFKSLAEKLKSFITGEPREEFRSFRSSVGSEPSGYRLAIEFMNARMCGIESRMNSLKINERIDRISFKLPNMDSKLKKAFLKKEIIQNILIRIEK
ncbi:hypothetical protein [Thermocrinis sp.]